MISLVAAIQKKDRGLGFRNALLVRIPDDLKRFKDITSGHPVIMGRKTFESIGRPLPGRTNIVITRDEAYAAPGVTACHSVEEALRCAKEIDPDVFVIGGGEIYRASLPYADRLYLTVIESDLPADTFFPPYDDFTAVIQEERHGDSSPPYSYLTLEK